MLAQGWFPDPYTRHDMRWFSDGRPAELVRDGDVEGCDRLEDVRTWTTSELEPGNAPTRSSPSALPTYPSPTGTGDPVRRTRWFVAVYLLAVAALVTTVGVLGPSDSHAPMILLAVALVVPGLVWQCVQGGERRSGGLPYTAVDEAWSPWRALSTGSGNPRYDRDRSLASADPRANDGSPRRVNLFADNRFLATVATSAAPDDSYTVGGVEYSTVSVTGPYLANDGLGLAFDVQLARPWRSNAPKS